MTWKIIYLRILRKNVKVVVEFKDGVRVLKEFPKAGIETNTQMFVEIKKRILQ